MKRFIFLLSMATLALSMQGFAATTTKTDPAASVSPAEKAKIEAVVRQFLLTQPEVLVEAMQVLQRKQYEQAEQTVKQTQAKAGSFATPLFHQNNDPIIGNPNGKITVVEFFDYQCPHCIDMAPVIADLVKSNPDVRVVYKDFPIRGPMSELAARAALAANKQGKYYQLNHALLTSNQPLNPDTIFKLAAANGINVEQLKKDMDDATINNQLKANIKLAQDLKLFGTPAFFIGKTNATGTATIAYVPGQMNLQQLLDAINNANH